MFRMPCTELIVELYGWAQLQDEVKRTRIVLEINAMTHSPMLRVRGKAQSINIFCLAR